MRITFKFVLVVTMLFAAAPSTASDTIFTVKLEVAKKLSETAQGAAYDQLLGLYLLSLPDTEEGLTQCLRSNPGPQYVEGFFHFEKSGRYLLELQPLSGFSACLKEVLENHNPPMPPMLPYLNPFEFVFDDT